MNAGIQIIAPDWQPPPGVRAAFTLRTGGVSVAPYDSLNVGTGIGDPAGSVAENRRRIRELLQLPDEPCWLEQVHGTHVVELMQGGCAATDQAVPGHSPPKADACVARISGAVCAIRVADCMPVLFAARDGSVVGAAHAGWRGLANGVLAATVRRLETPPSQLIAWMGPAIGRDHFEVGEEVRAAFVAPDAGAGAAFVPNARGRWQCDLYALARRNLLRLGVDEIHGGLWCTYAQADRFFSYRRDGRCGRMAALIWREPRAV